MFVMTTIVNIDKYKKVAVSSVKWTNSKVNYRNTAEIVVPGVVIGGSPYYDTGRLKNVETGSIFQRGMYVTIAAGYDGINITRFTGFIVRTDLEQATLKIYCEGWSWKLYDKQLSNNYYSFKLLDVLKDITTNTGIGLNHKDIRDVTFTGARVQQGWTGLQVIEYLRDSCLQNIYFDNNILYVGLPFLEADKANNDDNYRTENTIKFRMNWNVIDSSNLAYRDDIPPAKVILSFRTYTDPKLHFTSAKQPGDIVKRVKFHADDDYMKELAAKETTIKTIASYSGDFETFVMPYVKPGNIVSVEDGRFPLRNGSYLVEEVTGSMSPKGGRQTVKISIKLNDKKTN